MDAWLAPALLLSQPSTRHVGEKATLDSPGQKRGYGETRNSQEPEPGPWHVILSEPFNHLSHSDQR